MDVSEVRDIFNLDSVFLIEHFHPDKCYTSRWWALSISIKCRLAVYLWHKKWLALIYTRLLMGSASPISTLRKGRTIIQFPRPLTNFHGILVSIHVSVEDLRKQIFDKWKTAAVTFPLRNLTLNPLTWKTWWAPNNASRWQMGFNSAFKGLKQDAR